MKKTWRKCLGLLVSAGMILSLAACSGADKGSESKAAAETESAGTEASPEAGEDLPGQYASAAFQHLAAALAAAAFATAGRRQVDMLFGKGGYEAVAGGNGEFLVVVDGDGYVALRHQFGSQHQQQYNEQQYYGQKDRQSG